MNSQDNMRSPRSGYYLPLVLEIQLVNRQQHQHSPFQCNEMRAYELSGQYATSAVGILASRPGNLTCQQPATSTLTIPTQRHAGIRILRTICDLVGWDTCCLFWKLNLSAASSTNTHHLRLLSRQQHLQRTTASITLGRWSRSKARTAIMVIEGFLASDPLQTRTWLLLASEER